MGDRDPSRDAEVGAGALRATLRVRQALPGFTARGRRSLAAALAFLLLAGAAAAELTSDEEIRTATFVDLGFDQGGSAPAGRTTTRR